MNRSGYEFVAYDADGNVVHSEPARHNRTLLIYAMEQEQDDPRVVEVAFVDSNREIETIKTMHYPA